MKLCSASTEGRAVSYGVWDFVTCKNLNNNRNSYTKVIERNIEFVTYYFYKPTFKYIRNYHIGLSKLLKTK